MIKYMRGIAFLLFGIAMIGIAIVCALIGAEGSNLFYVFMLVALVVGAVCSILGFAIILYIYKTEEWHDDNSG